MQHVFELIVLAEACMCGVHVEEVHDLAACRARLATCFPIRRVVRDAHAEASGVIRVLFSQLLVTLRGPGKLPILFLPQKRVYPERELGPHYLPPASRRSTLHRQAPNPKMQLDGREEYTVMHRHVA
jgi:hypothetical protein